jgi:hypothetical protein
VVGAAGHSFRPDALEKGNRSPPPLEEALAQPLAWRQTAGAFCATRNDAWCGLRAAAQDDMSNEAGAGPNLITHGDMGDSDV